MSTYQHPGVIERAVAALKKDLLRDGGPQISTVRHYNFAILPYPPAEEFPLRAAIHNLSEELRAGGWTIGNIALHKLLYARIRAEGPEFYQAMVEREKRLAQAADPRRGLRSLKERIVNMADGPDGIAKEVIRSVNRILDENPENADRTVIFLGRAGALYPFLRTSALLKRLTGQTRNAPVVLLYPGTVDAEGGLSFMGVLPADRDYRPRIYR
jgi:hypothetical protein